MPAFSVVMIAQDAERSLAWALDSACGADELLVVDGGSRDRTCSIAAAAGARVLERRFDDYSSQKNFANSNAAHDWVFSLDADEAIDPVLGAALDRFRRTSAERLPAGYRVERRSFFLGRWVRHGGWWPDRAVRLFNRHQASWRGIVHERLELHGAIEDLPGHLEHRTYADTEDQRFRLERYAQLWARAQRQEGRSGSHLRLLAGPPLAFLGRFIARLGLLDGRAGLWIAWGQARHVFRRETILLSGADRDSDNEPARRSLSED